MPSSSGTTTSMKPETRSPPALSWTRTGVHAPILNAFAPPKPILTLCTSIGGCGRSGRLRPGRMTARPRADSQNPAARGSGTAGLVEGSIRRGRTGCGLSSGAIS